MNILYHISKASKEDYCQIIELWESSVRATHHFLKEEDILFYKDRILDKYFDLVDLYIVKNSKRMLGFMGVGDGSIEMLFVDPLARGKGVGKYLLCYGVSELNIKKVDVNEENEQAVGFYQKLGFMVKGRSDLDGEGKPYPILHMELS